MSGLTPADILDKAADHIQLYGWIQDEFYESLGTDGKLNPRLRGVQAKDPMQCPVCAGGGINAAAGHAPDLEDTVGFPDGPHGEAIKAFAGYVDPAYGTTDDDSGYDDRPYALIGNWNDGPRQTAEQVIAALRACAADLRKEAK